MNSPYYNPQFCEIPEHPIVKLKPDPKCIFLRVNPFQTIVMILQLLLIFPIIKIVINCLVLKNTDYYFSTQRIRIDSGLFNLKSDEILLFRVTDLWIMRPFLYRFFGLSDIYISSMDVKSRIAVFKGIPNSEAEKLRIVLQKHIAIERNRHRLDPPGSWKL